MVNMCEFRAFKVEKAYGVILVSPCMLTPTLTVGNMLSNLQDLCHWQQRAVPSTNSASPALTASASAWRTSVTIMTTAATEVTSSIVRQIAPVSYIDSAASTLHDCSCLATCTCMFHSTWFTELQQLVAHLLVKNSSLGRSGRGTPSVAVLCWLINVYCYTVCCSVIWFCMCRLSGRFLAVSLQRCLHSRGQALWAPAHHLPLLLLQRALLRQLVLLVLPRAVLRLSRGPLQHDWRHVVRGRASLRSVY